MTVIAAKTSEKEKRMRAEIVIMDKIAKRIAANPKEARAFLLKGGFITPTGKLTKRYGG